MRRTEPAPAITREAQMELEARRRVLADKENWLLATEVSDMAGFSPINRRAQPNNWKRKRFIFSITHLGKDYFPAFGLDPAKQYRPLASLAPILAILYSKKDDWGIAYWFASANSFLGGERPQDMLAKYPERVLAAAKTNIVGVVHG